MAVRKRVVIGQLLPFGCEVVCARNCTFFVHSVCTEFRCHNPHRMRASPQWLSQNIDLSSAHYRRGGPEKRHHASEKPPERSGRVPLSQFPPHGFHSRVSYERPNDRSCMRIILLDGRQQELCPEDDIGRNPRWGFDRFELDRSGRVLHYSTTFSSRNSNLPRGRSSLLG